MRTVLRLLGSRYGIGLILAVVVLGVVGLAKAFVGDRTPDVPIGPVVSPVSTAAAPDASLGDDSVDDTTSGVPGSSLSPNAPTADKVAARFMAAWLKHSGVSGDQWRTALKPNGLAEFVAQEEMSRFSGFWFSPDGKRIAFQATDHTGVEQLSVTGSRPLYVIGTPSAVTTPD